MASCSLLLVRPSRAPRSCPGEPHDTHSSSCVTVHEVRRQGALQTGGIIGAGHRKDHPVLTMARTLITLTCMHGSVNPSARTRMYMHVPNARKRRKGERERFQYAHPHIRAPISISRAAHHALFHQQHHQRYTPSSGNASKSNFSFVLSFLRSLRTFPLDFLNVAISSTEA